MLASTASQREGLDGLPEMIAPYVYDGNMATMKKTKGQKAESKRLTAMGLSEARARLKEIDKQKAANPGIGFKIPKKEEAQLRKFVMQYGKAKPMKKQAPSAMKKAAKPKAKPKAAGRSNVVPTPLSPLFKPKGK